MHKRTLLATATLIALLLSAGSLQTVHTAVEAEPAPHALDLQTTQSAEVPTGPLWGAAWGWGMEWGVVSAFVCAVFSGPGGIACGIAGAA